MTFQKIKRTRKEKTIKSFAIIGTGAIGGYCAFKLGEANLDVHCLLRSEYAHVKQHGLTVIANGKETTLPVHAYQQASDLPPCDVVIIALKTTDNHQLKKILATIVNEHSTVVVIQNGIGMEAEIAQLIPSDQIIGASTILKVTKIAPGVIKHFGFAAIEFAQYFKNNRHKATPDKVRQLAEIFETIGFTSTAMPHLPTIRWKKLVANIPISGLSVVLNASTNDLVNHRSSYELLLRLTQEVITAGKQCGADIPDDMFDIRVKLFQKLKTMEKSNFSMKDDYDQKKPMELTSIYENPINIAKTNQVEMPLTQMLYQQLVYLNDKNLP